MPAKEIKELRQAGRLNEAYEMAKAELDEAPENIWAKRNISWVYMDMAKEHLGTYAFEKVLDELVALEMPENESLFYEQLAWNVGKHISKLLYPNSSNDDSLSIFNLLHKIRELPFSRTSGLSYLLQMFHKSFKRERGGGFDARNFEVNTSYLALMDWWDWEYFSDEDYQVQNYNGKQIMSLVEQIIIGYSKVLLEGEPSLSEEVRLGVNVTKREVNVERVNEFLPFINQVIESHPEYQYPVYFKVQLLQSIGKIEEAKEAVLPFVKKKQRDFWTWDLLGDLQAKGGDEQMGCYCKALSLPGDHKFRIKIHEKLGALLVEKQRYSEAKYEYHQVIKIRESNQWKITRELEAVIESDWFQSAEASKNNKTLYAEYIPYAEELLYHDIPETPIVIEFVNSSKQMVNFVHDKKLHGFFSYRGLSIQPAIGDVYFVRLSPKGSDGFYLVHTINKPEMNDGLELPALQELEGLVRQREGQSFAFLEDCFIPPDVVKQYKLSDGNAIQGKALMSYNKKKEEWGWKLIAVTSQ